MDYDRLKTWVGPTYKRVVRSESTYKQTEELLASELTRLLEYYRKLDGAQSMRLVRDLIDFCLRRFHQYGVKERHGAHYVQDGCCGPQIFEHLVPQKVLRDLLLHEEISIKYAMHAPTVWISRENNSKLQKSGLISTTNDVVFPFRRYLSAGIDSSFITLRGESIEDLSNWSLHDHFHMVFHLGTSSSLESFE
jgi:hypothetical protein